MTENAKANNNEQNKPSPKWSPVDNDSVVDMLKEE